MRALLAFPLAVLLATTAAAQPHAPPTAQPTAKPPAAKPAPAAAPGPKSIGIFDEWQAATYEEGGQAVCYAFAKAKTSTPKIPGRGEAVLTVTQRVSGRDAVAFSAGFEFAAGATVEVEVDKTKLEFYTAKRSAFARDGHATVLLLAKNPKIKVAVHSPHPQKSTVTDTFGLFGFNRAYDAITKACPPPKP